MFIISLEHWGLSVPSDLGEDHSYSPLAKRSGSLCVERFPQQESRWPFGLPSGVRLHGYRQPSVLQEYGLGIGESKDDCPYNSSMCPGALVCDDDNMLG